MYNVIFFALVADIVAQGVGQIPLPTGCNVGSPTICPGGPPGSNSCLPNGPFCPPAANSSYALHDACGNAPQPAITRSRQGCKANSFCKEGSLPPAGWKPSKMQCKPTPYPLWPGPPGSEANKTCPGLPKELVPGSAFTNERIGGEWPVPECIGVSPVFNWVISSCDAVGGLGLNKPFPYGDRRNAFGVACKVNPYSTVDVRYMATYQLKNGAWDLVKDSSIFLEPGEDYADLSRLQHPSFGAFWATGFYPRNTADQTVTGAGPPGMLFIMSSDRFYNGALFLMNQVILDRGPSHGVPNCNQSIHNCWGAPPNGIGAGEIDVLETPFWPCAFNENGTKSKLCSEKGYDRMYSTTSDNQGGGGPFPHAWGPFGGGRHSNAFFTHIGSRPSIVAAVIDSMGTTIYLNPSWEGVNGRASAERLTTLQPSTWDDAYWLPRGCPGKDGKWGHYGPHVNVSNKMSAASEATCKRIGSLGLKYGGPDSWHWCAESKAGCGSSSFTTVTPSLLWWDFFQDTAQITEDFFAKSGRLPVQMMTDNLDVEPLFI